MFTADNLLEGNNAVCFAYQAAPDLLEGVVSDVVGALDVGGVGWGVRCWKGLMRERQFELFPGYMELGADGS